MIEQTHSQAIILKCTPYGENDRIVMLMTETLGRISVYAAGKSMIWMQPLSHVEMLLTPGRNDLYRTKEATLINPYFALRDSFTSLKSALKMVEIVLSLPSMIPKPLLYELFKIYLEKMSSTTNPSNLYYSFLLKTLKEEGLLALEEDGSLSTCDLSLPPSLSPLLTSRRFSEIEAFSMSKEEIALLESFDLHATLKFW